MNKQYIENSIARVINQMPSAGFEKLANTPVVKMSKYDYITAQPKKQMRQKLSLAFACCFAVLVCFTGFFDQFIRADSIISLDVNPSIEIVLNKQNHILSVNALNEDAQKIIEGIDYKNSDLEHIVDALLNSMINNGYLSNDKNVIMISVKNNNLKKADDLTVLLNENIRKSAAAYNISPYLLNEVFKTDKKALYMAEKYGVSEGKINLINKILSYDNSYSINELVNMSINDLLSICKESEFKLEELFDFDDDSYDYENSDDENYNNSDSSLENDESESSHNNDSSDDLENSDDESSDALTDNDKLDNLKDND